MAVPIIIGARLAEELYLHLLELAGPEREIPRRDLVAEGLADLGDSERHLDPRRVQDVQEIGEDALGRLGPQVGHGRGVLGRPDERFEHQVKQPRFGQVAAAAGTDAGEPLGGLRDQAVQLTACATGELRLVGVARVVVRFADALGHFLEGRRVVAFVGVVPG